MINTSYDKIPKNEVDKFRYLTELIKEKDQITTSLNFHFVHAERLLNEEIIKTQKNLFIVTKKDPLELPNPEGSSVVLKEKIFIPIQKYPKYNFIGRILGPRGLTAQQLENDLECKIMVRGKGSNRDKNPRVNLNLPAFEHLKEELHILITVEDTKNRADLKMQRAIKEIKKLLIPPEIGEDVLKKKQLFELAILKGTIYHNNNYNKKIEEKTTPSPNPKPNLTYFLQTPLEITQDNLPILNEYTKYLCSQPPTFELADQTSSTPPTIPISSLHPGMIYPYYLGNCAKYLTYPNLYYENETHKRKFLNRVREHPYTKN